MGRKDPSSAAEAKLLEFTALMNHDSSQRPGGPRKTPHSRAINPAVNKVGALRASERPRRIDMARAALPILNLSKVRHNLSEEAELATGIYDDISLIDQKEESTPLDLIGARLAAVQEIANTDKAKGTNIVQPSPKFGVYGEDRVENTKKLTISSNREKTPLVKQFGLNAHQFLPLTQFPLSAQTQRRAHVKAPTLHTFSKSGSLTFRGMTAPSNSESGQTLGAATERVNEPLELAAGALLTKREVRTESQKPQTSEGVPKAIDGASWAESRKSQGALRQNWPPPGRGVISAGNLSTRGFSSAERMQLEEKFKLKLKTPRPLPEDITAESEACHRQSSNTFVHAGLENKSEEYEYPTPFEYEAIRVEYDFAALISFTRYRSSVMEKMTESS